MEWTDYPTKPNLNLSFRTAWALSYLCPPEGLEPHFPHGMGIESPMPPRGFEDLASLTLSQAALRILDWLYDGISLPQVLQPNQTQPKLARNDEIRKRYAAGETLVALAAEYCISKQRVQQIVTGSPD